MDRLAPDLRRRRTLRLPGWDYAAAGAYFVTIVTHERWSLFGTVRDGAMTLSPCGNIVREEWLASAAIRREIELDTFVVMPNHVHGIVWIVETGPEGGWSRTGDPVAATRPGTHRGPPTVRRPRSLGAFVAGFKSAATKRINEIRGVSGSPVWQRNYYERVIRNDRELAAVQTYIEENPARWAEDRENPDRILAWQPHLPGRP